MLNHVATTLARHPIGRYIVTMKSNIASSCRRVMSLACTARSRDDFGFSKCLKQVTCRLQRGLLPSSRVVQKPGTTRNGKNSKRSTNHTSRTRTSAAIIMLSSDQSQRLWATGVVQLTFHRLEHPGTILHRKDHTCSLSHSPYRTLRWSPRLRTSVGPRLPRV